MHLSAADDVEYLPVEFDSPAGTPTPVPESSWTWESVAAKGLDTAALITQYQTQADVAKAQAQYAYRVQNQPYTTARLPGGTVTYPGYGLPVNASGAQSQNDTWLLLAAVGIIGGAYIFTRK